MKTLKNNTHVDFLSETSTFPAISIGKKITNVLIVEDNKKVLDKYLLPCLHKASNSIENIKIVDNTTEAMGEIVRNGFQLMILDMHFSFGTTKDVHGIDLVQAAYIANKKVIVTSRRNYIKHIEKRMNKSLTNIPQIEYLYKPYTKQDFSQAFLKLQKLPGRDPKQVFNEIYDELKVEKESIFYKFPFLRVY